jgi:hypothetical protein
MINVAYFSLTVAFYELHQFIVQKMQNQNSRFKSTDF